jgi:hypothetical protein
MFVPSWPRMEVVLCSHELDAEGKNEVDAEG